MKRFLRDFLAVGVLELIYVTGVWMLARFVIEMPFWLIGPLWGTQMLRWLLVRKLPYSF